MVGPERKRGAESEEIRRLSERASALIAAVFVLLALFFSNAAPDGFNKLVSALAEPMDRGSSPTPSPSPDASVSIRLADVDSDVSPDIVIKLQSIAPSGKSIPLRGDEPTVLVYHTHDTEAYRQTPDATYEPSGDFRTEQEEESVIAVGEELCRILREEYGIIAVHAEERHEKPLITSAYSRSLRTMLRYKEEYPSIEMFIDLHRDGVAETGFEDDFVTVDGLECARMMFVVGTGKSGKTAQNSPTDPPGVASELPDFESNYALAARLTEELLSYDPHFMRNLRVKAGKYNQQVSSQCLLVEVGHNGNTLEQAKNSMIYLAKAIAKLSEGE